MNRKEKIYYRLSRIGTVLKPGKVLIFWDNIIEIMEPYSRRGLDYKEFRNEAELRSYVEERLANRGCSLKNIDDLDATIVTAEPIEDMSATDVIKVTLRTAINNVDDEDTLEYSGIC